MSFSRNQAIFLTVLFFLFLINLAVLDFVIFSRSQETTSVQPVTTTESEKITITPTMAPDKDESCPASCLQAISEANDAVLEQIPATSPSAATGVVSQTGVKEFYIPVGSGSTQSRDWIELAGVEAVIDSANFPNVKSVIFEASLRVPTANGRVYAKLYDVTAKHDVWYSEVWAEGSTSYRAESANINLSSGRHLYRLMMKSTMGYEALLDSARLKIVLE